VEVYSIGFGGHSAGEFFAKLDSVGIKRLLDVRLNNVSQLAGFSKRGDLSFFLDRITGAEYIHDLDLAPTPEMMTAYRSKQLRWQEYERLFLQLLADRKVELRYGPDSFTTPTVLLCSEPTARQCHRRLVLEYLQRTSIPSLEPIHL
jgi:uncharacterized protein (DUF488 family)